MAKLFGVHETTLKPGANAQEFERFFREEWVHLPATAGWKSYLLRGDRGDRVGQYLLLFEIESEESRARLNRGNGALTEEGQRWAESAKAAIEKWATFASGPGSPTFTDYVVVEQPPTDGKPLADRVLVRRETGHLLREGRPVGQAMPEDRAAPDGTQRT